MKNLPSQSECNLPTKMKDTNVEAENAILIAVVTPFGPLQLGEPQVFHRQKATEIMRNFLNGCLFWSQPGPQKISSCSCSCSCCCCCCCCCCCTLLCGPSPLISVFHIHLESRARGKPIGNEYFESSCATPFLPQTKLRYLQCPTQGAGHHKKRWTRPGAYVYLKYTGLIQTLFKSESSFEQTDPKGSCNLHRVTAKNKGMWFQQCFFCILQQHGFAHLINDENWQRVSHCPKIRRCFSWNTAE